MNNISEKEKGMSLLKELIVLLSKIDSIPLSVVNALPAMPGFGRDCVNQLVVDCKLLYSATENEAELFLCKLPSLEYPGVDNKEPKPLISQLEQAVCWCKEWLDELPESASDYIMGDPSSSFGNSF